MSDATCADCGGALPKNPYRQQARSSGRSVCDSCYESWVRREMREQSAPLVVVDMDYRPASYRKPRRPSVKAIIKRCREQFAFVATVGLLLLAGCESPTLAPPREALRLPDSVVFNQPPFEIVPVLYQADPPAPPAPDVVEFEPSFVVVLPERKTAGFRQTLRVQTVGIPDALPLRWKLPSASVAVGDATVNFADECEVTEKGRRLSFSWPVPGPLAFRVTAGIAVRDEAGQVIGFDVLEQEFTLTQVAIGPTPEPPKPDKPTPDEPIVKPLPAEGLRVLIVSENEARHELSPGQVGEIFGTKLAAYLNENCVKVGGKPEWRILDPHAPMEAASEVWVEAMRRPRSAHHWLLVSNGKAGWEGPLPKTADEVIAIVERVKGGE